MDYFRIKRKINKHEGRESREQGRGKGRELRNSEK
jgi:hypothetical protein